MQFSQDAFNGLIIQTDAIPADSKAFDAALVDILSFAREKQKGITWLTLPIEKAHHVGCATGKGFVFHCCSPHEVTLVHKNIPHQFVPFMPTHTVGAGALITNAQNEILVVQEYGMKGYKLPGGHVEEGERIAEAVVREVLEETGIVAEFISILGFTNKHPYRFGKSNLYFICELKALNSKISVQDPQEIIDARWISLDEFLENPYNSAYNHELFSALKGNTGMPLQELENNAGIHKKLEIYFNNHKES